MGWASSVKDTAVALYDTVTEENFEADDNIKTDMIIDAMETGDDIDLYLQHTKDPEKWRGLVGRRFMNRYPNASEEKMFELIKAPKASKELVQENPISRFFGGVGRDYRELAYGVGKLAVGREDTDPVQLERKQKIIENDIANSFRQGYLANYDLDGERDEAQNWWAGAGEMAIEGTMGVGVGRSAKTMSKAVIGDFFLNVGSETVRYQEHKNLGRTLTAVGVGTAASVVGTYLGGLAKDAPIADQKSMAMLDEQLAFLEDMDRNLGANFTMEMLDDPAKLKALVEETAQNAGERDRLFAVMDKIEVDVIKRINDAAEAIGTDAKMLSKYKNGVVNAEQMGEEFGNFLREAKEWYKADENNLYKFAKETDIDPETGVQRLYTTDDLFTTINSIGVRNKEALSVYNNEWRFLDSIETPQMKELDLNIISSRKEVKSANSKITTLEKRLRKGGARKIILAEEIKEIGDNTKTSAFKRKFQERTMLDNDLANWSTELEDLKISKNSYLDGLETMDREKLLMTPKGDENVDILNANANQLRLVDQRLSEKINAPGGILSTSDKTQMGALKEIHQAHQVFMNKTIVDDKFKSIMKQAKETSYKRFQLTGRKSIMGDVDTALASNNPKDLFDLVSTSKDAVPNLRALGKHVGKDSEIYQALTAKVFRDKLMSGGVEVYTGPLERHAKIDFGQLAKNFEKIDMAQLEELAPHVAKRFKSIKYLSRTFSGTFEELARSKAIPVEKLNSLKGRLMNHVKTAMLDTAEWGTDIGYGVAKTAKHLQGVEDPQFKGTYKPRWYDRGANFEDLINSTIHQMHNKSAELKFRALQETADKMEQIARFERVKRMKEMKKDFKEGVDKAGNKLLDKLDQHPKILGGADYADEIGDTAKYNEAVEMAMKDETPGAIFKKTGMVNVNGSMGVPAYSFANKLDEFNLPLPGEGTVDLGSLLSWQNMDDPLIKAHPELWYVKIRTDGTLSAGEASYNRKSNTITVSPQATGKDLSHEIQHSLQKILGKRGGGTSAQYVAENSEVVGHFIKESGLETKDFTMSELASLNSVLTFNHTKSLQAFPPVVKESLWDALSKMQVSYNKLHNTTTFSDNIYDNFEQMLPYNRYRAIPGELEASLAEEIGIGYKPNFFEFVTNKRRGKIAQSYYDANTRFYNPDVVQNSEAVNKSLKSGNPKFIKELPLPDRQAAADDIWSIDTMNGVGATSNTFKENVAYNGFTIKAKPSDFINLASEAKHLDTEYMSKQVASGEKLGPPFLKASYNEATDTLMIGGHEGRHRVEYVRKMFGDDVDIPIHITRLEDMEGYEIKNARVKREGTIGKNTKWVDQDGNSIDGKVSSQFEYEMYVALGIVGAGSATSSEAGLLLYGDRDKEASYGKLYTDDGRWQIMGRPVTEIPTNRIKDFDQDVQLEGVGADTVAAGAIIKDPAYAKEVHMQMNKSKGAIIQLANTPVSFDEDLPSYVGGATKSFDKEVLINPNNTDSENRTALIHEFQHILQLVDKKNPFHKEISPFNFYKQEYDKRGFEAEARLAENRSKYPERLTNAKSKYGIHPYLSFDLITGEFDITNAIDIFTSNVIARRAGPEQVAEAVQALYKEKVRLDKLVDTDMQFAGIILSATPENINTGETGYQVRRAGSKQDTITKEVFSREKGFLETVGAGVRGWFE